MTNCIIFGINVIGQINIPKPLWVFFSRYYYFFNIFIILFLAIYFLFNLHIERKSIFKPTSPATF